MFHINENHDIEFVEKDILLYPPKVKHSGLIIRDDTDWPCVQSFLHHLNMDCRLEKGYGLWQV
jgi:hypothetical protein